MTKEFDARNENKSRSVCAAMAEAADTGKRVLTERERAILDMWPKFGDGEYAWIGDAVEAHHGGAITIEAIEFSHGKVCVKDDEDGDWDTSMYAMHPLKRPATKVLDADGVEVHDGDTVYELETGEEYKVDRVFSGAPDPDFPDHAIRCNKVADPIMHVFKPDQLTHRHIVLDADGVEIKVGDTVWHEDGSELHVIGFGDAQDGETMLVVEYAAGPTKWGEVRCLSVTHTRPAPKVLDADGAEIKVGDTVRSSMYGDNDFTVSRFVKNCKGETFVMVEEMWSGLPPLTVTHARPDSWEQLEEDAGEDPFRYCKTVGKRLDTFDNAEVFKSADIVRRAKKLAKVEVD